MDGKEFTGRLEHWLFQPIGDKFVVWGDLYEDVNQRWPDVTNVRTSYVVDYNKEEGWVQTRNSLYKLGEESVYANR